MGRGKIIDNNLNSSLTFIIINEDIFVSGKVLVVVAVTDDDGERVGSRCRWVAAVLHNDWHVVFFLLLAVKRHQACHNS